MNKRISIINGPNLNLLGVREPEKYGTQNFDSYLNELKKKFPEVEIEYFQSNIEGELIDEIQRVGFDFDGLIINAGGYTHTSVAIGDAIASIKTPAIEVHITNIFSREEFRHKSYLSTNCIAVITGLGMMGYESGLKYFICSS